MKKTKIKDNVKRGSKNQKKLKKKGREDFFETE